MRAGLSAGAGARAAAGAAGCSEYHYYDIDVTLHTTPRAVQAEHRSPSPELPRVRDRRRHADFYLPERELPARPPAVTDHMGVFEYSTFADSGTLTFTFRAYDGRRAIRRLPASAQGPTTDHRRRATTTTTR